MRGNPDNLRRAAAAKKAAAHGENLELRRRLGPRPTSPATDG